MEEGGSSTILVVDDEPSIRLLCRVNLELEGYRVLEAGTIEEARQLLSANPVRAILLDVHVGSGDGRELLREVRETDPGLRVALFTGTADLSPVERASADGVIPKPFPIDELVGTVNRLAAR
jgi:two-component system C4-dicarboxylate transport response regulator DctD